MNKKINCNLTGPCISSSSWPVHLFIYQHEERNLYYNEGKLLSLGIFLPLEKRFEKLKWVFFNSTELHTSEKTRRCRVKMYIEKELIKHLSLIVPSRAPGNISTSPINSTSFSVTWQQVPLEHMNGIVLGYKISLENMDDATEVSSETVHVNQTMTVLRESEPTSRFCVRLLAFTSKGNGKRSDCVEGWTLSEGKGLNPESLLANFK